MGGKQSVVAVRPLLWVLIFVVELIPVISVTQVATEVVISAFRFLALSGCLIPYNMFR